MRIIQVDLDKDFSDVISEALSILNIGGVIIYPIDTLYGLGANALDESAVKKVFEIKKRSFSKPLPIIVKNMVWADELAHINQKSKNLLSKAWPGSMTAVLPKKNNVPEILTSGRQGVGIRIPGFAFTNKLLGRFGYPLTSTSANISGQEPTNNISTIIEIFSKSTVRPDLIIDAGILPKSEPSMVIDLTGDRPKVLRVSPTKPEKLLELLELGGR